MASVLPRLANCAREHFDPVPMGWRTFEVTTRIELLDRTGARRVWLPLPSMRDDAWIRPMGNTWSGNARIARPLTTASGESQMLFAQWDAGEPTPVIEVTSQFATRDRKTDWRARNNQRLTASEQEFYTSATSLIPIDGIVRDTALAATRSARTDREKAQAIYEWVVENSVRDPQTRGCGLGDIGTMLLTGNLRGKCADINTLFVGLCRSLGIAARDLYGVRVAQSRFGYRSLGAGGDISKAQHCRAEVFLNDYGWVPADPADVRKVVLEERPGLTLSHPLVSQVREKLFGAWEGNWVPFNFEHDVQLPMSDGTILPFFMYPQGETASGRLDSLDPATFRYSLTSVEIPA
ncbi:MAG: transglutaminase-like domain-containing protein [Burkholderiales bacterium]|jgi:transglutaminase-like putative cysteine protease